MASQPPCPTLEAQLSRAGAAILGSYSEPKSSTSGKGWEPSYSQDLASLLFSPLGDGVGFTAITPQTPRITRRLQSAIKECFDPRTFQADAANIDAALGQASAETLADVEPPVLDGPSSSLSNSPPPAPCEQFTTELPRHFPRPWELSWWHAFDREKFLRYGLVPVIKEQAPGIHDLNNYKPQSLDYAYNDGKPRGEISPYIIGTMQDQNTNLLHQPPPHHSFEPADYTYPDVTMGDAPHMEEPTLYQMQEYPQEVHGDFDDFQPLQIYGVNPPSPIYSSPPSDVLVPAHALAAYRPITNKKEAFNEALSERAKKMAERSQKAQITYGQGRYREPWGLRVGRVRYTFTYNIHGQLENWPMGADELRAYLLNMFSGPVADPHIRYKPRMLIQYTPGDCRDRYATTINGNKCRFAECSGDNHGISPGQVRVALDETTHENHDPYVVAGYLHLFCMEKYLDMTKIVEHCNIHPETRRLLDFEGRNPMAINKHSSLSLGIAQKYINDIRNNGKVPTGQNGSPWVYEDTLSWKLVREYMKVESKSKLGTRKKRAGNDIGVHFGDLDKMMELREQNRENNRKKNAISKMVMKKLENGESLEDLELSPSFLLTVEKVAPNAWKPKQIANQPATLQPTSSSDLHQRRQASSPRPGPTSQIIKVHEDDKELSGHEFPDYVVLMPGAEPAARPTPRRRSTRIRSKVSASVPAPSRCRKRAHSDSDGGVSPKSSFPMPKKWKGL